MAAQQRAGGEGRHQQGGEVRHQQGGGVRVGAERLCLQWLLLLLLLSTLLSVGVGVLGHDQVSSHMETAHKHMDVGELQRTFQVDHHHQVPEYEVVRVDRVSIGRHRRSDSVEHHVRLVTGNRRLGLRLRPNDQLVPRHLPVLLADGQSRQQGADVHYEAEESEDEVGQVFQDERSEAAMLLFRDSEDDALLMDGTIGDELVVKPLSANVRRKLAADPAFMARMDVNLESRNINKDDNKDDLWMDKEDEDVGRVETNELDDYAFLDEYEDLRDESFFNSTRFKRDVGSSNNINTHFHIVYKRQAPHVGHHGDYDFMEAGVGRMRVKRSRSSEWSEDGSNRERRQTPYLIFPEILCIVDYDGYRLHGKDNVAIKRYVISFWNGIDLRYKLLKNPKVRVSIAGIIISRGRDATPYLERNRIGRDAIDSASALTDMGKYLFLERRLPVYDIAVAITKLDMCRRKTRFGECNRGTAGFAYVGGACVVNKRLEKVNSVAIVEDTGGFSGIIVAAHELGHLLGAVHDGSPPPSYLGGPGARKCRWEDGFIMSDLRHTSKGFRWSHCSVLQFNHFLNGETATCMYNSPHEHDALPRVLPGKLMSLDAQCRKDRGTSACFKDDRVCAQLFCFDAASGYCVSYRPAAEGSRCGEGFICLNGKCVREPENSVDFGGEIVRSGSKKRARHRHDYYYDESEEIDEIDDFAPRNDSGTKTTTQRPTSSTPSPHVSNPTPISTTPRTSPATRTTRRRTRTTRRPATRTTTTTTTRSSTSRTTRSSTSSSTSRRPPRPRSLSRSLTSKKKKKSSSSSGQVSRPSNARQRLLPWWTRLRGPSPVSKVSKVESKNSANDVNSKCEDRIESIAGSMTCRSFLRSFAFQYCRHAYIEKNCCHSHRHYCTSDKKENDKKKNEDKDKE